MIDYELDLPHKISTTRVSGRLSFAELANYLHRLLRDPKFRTDFDALIVASDVAAVPPSSAVSTLGPLLRAWSSRRRGVRWAFVLPTPDTREFAERALVAVNLPEVVIRCFTSEEDASAWLIAARGPHAKQPMATLTRIRPEQLRSADDRAQRRRSA